MTAVADLRKALAKLERSSYWEGYMRAVIDVENAILAGDLDAWLDRIRDAEITPNGDIVLPDAQTAR